MSFAQSQIATLSHGDEIKTFYGYDSFVEAMNEAEHGDVIALSSGQFKAAWITKAITLRGAGMVEINDEEGYQNPTIINGELGISLNKSVSERLSIEGIKFSNSLYYSGVIQSPIFKKCNFFEVSNYERSYNHTDSLRNALFLNCRIKYGFELRGQTKCFNCVIDRAYITPNSKPSGKSGTEYWQNADNYFEFTNCVLTNLSYRLEYSSFLNCYITSGWALSYNCIVKNCVSDATTTFGGRQEPSNKICSTTEFFNNNEFENGYFSDEKKFTLTEEAATTYLGDDGTQIGIYGGVMPYDEHTILPKITKCNVAGKSTADGKLSVDIQVEAAQ